MRNFAVIILCMLGAGLFTEGLCADASAPGDVKISERRAGGVIEIFAENHSDKTLTLTLTLSNIANAKSDGWPTKVTKRCAAGDRVLMTALVQTDGAPAATYSGSLNSTDAAPVVQQDAAPQPAPVQALQPAQQQTTAKSDAPLTGKMFSFIPVDPQFSYALPYERGTKRLVSQGYNGRASHTGLYALDFDMPQGTPVCAARDGIVVDLQNARGYPDSDVTLGNLIKILHADGTVAIYAQLAPEGMRVKPGQPVHAGDVIGTSGTTGHSNGPHLHFEVECTRVCTGVTEKGARDSIPVVFKAYEGDRLTPEAGYSYTAQ
jgi:murein DD-endopeptidase MepM/ murein hydrolase activator NlpD